MKQVVADDAVAARLDFRDVDAIDAKTVYALSIGNGPASRIYRTDDGGATWAKHNMKNVHDDLHGLWIDPNDAEHLVLAGDGERVDRLCELNVIEQVVNVCETTIVQDAWSRGQDLTVHGWAYRLDTGLVNDLGMSSSSTEEMLERYAKSIKRYESE